MSDRNRSHLQAALRIRANLRLKFASSSSDMHVTDEFRAFGNVALSRRTGEFGDDERLKQL